jgi:uncharacterized repeat protein (TIGR01451 family)
MIKIRDAILLLGIVLLAACVQRGDGGAQNSQAADIVVTATGPTAPIASGESAEFRIKVANAGPNDASNVSIVDTVGVQSKLVSMTCMALGRAICPSPVGVSMMVTKLPNGSSLNFIVTLKLADMATGTIVNSLVANFDKDDEPNNNSVAIDAIVR